MISKRYQYTLVSLLGLSILAVYLGGYGPLEIKTASYFDVTTNKFFKTSPPGSKPFPKKIWQIWKTPPQRFNEDDRKVSVSWVMRNPRHQYELLTLATADDFVSERFYGEPEIIDVMHRIMDPILLVDFLRYLILLAEGGVYSDFDTICTQSIHDWIPMHLLDQTNAVLGLEYDQKDGNEDLTMVGPIQFCQWTMMSKPRHFLMETIVRRVMERLERLSSGRYRRIKAATRFEVLNTTGPFVFTDAVYDVLSALTGTQVSWQNFTNLEDPTLFGDVLILPVQKFAGFGSEEHGYHGQFVQHMWKGNWKSSHPEQTAPSSDGGGNSEATQTGPEDQSEGNKEQDGENDTAAEAGGDKQRNPGAKQDGGKGEETPAVDDVDKTAEEDGERTA